MKRFIFCFLAFYLVALGCYAQKGTTAYLDEKKGFKGIVLGDSISKYKEMLVAKDGGYEVSDSTLLHIGGEVKLSFILVKEYKGLVCSIDASAKKQYGTKLFDIFRSAYGNAYVQINKFKENYIWLTENVELDFLNDGKYSVFVYKDAKLEIQKAKEERAKINQAADDL